MSKWKNESGSVLVVSALSMTVLLGFVAFATDVGLLLRQRRMAQTAADAAAMAAATESMNEGTPASVTSGMWTAAYHDAVMNGFTPGASNGTANSSTGVTLTLLVTPDIGISGYNTAGYIQAVVSMKTPTMFMALFGALRGQDYGNINVGATAIAADTIQSDGCIYVQNPPTLSGTVANPAVDMSGNSLIAAASCGMTANGNLTMGGNGTIDAKFVAVTGDITGKNAGNWFSGVPTQNDPLERLQETANQPSVPSGTAAGGACTAPTGSGMSCIYDYNGGNLSGTLQSNTIYYFDNQVNSGHGPYITGAASGTNDTIFLANDIPFDFDNNGSVCITPPGFVSASSNPCSVQNNSGTCVGSANPLCGILVDAPTDGNGGTSTTGTYSCSTGKGNNGNNPGEIYLDFGSSTTVVQGVIYAPYMQLFGQDKGAATTFNADLVVGNICQQSSTFDVDGFSGPWSPLTRAGLVY